MVGEISKIRYCIKNNQYVISFLITLSTILIVIHFNIPNPAIVCLIAVVFSTFFCGFNCGIISGLLTIIYCGFFFSISGTLLSYTSENFYKMIVILIVIFTKIFIVGTLKRRVDKRTRELELTNKQLQMLSTLDGLTGISNRRCFEELLTQEWRRNLRDKTPISVALIDIDFFKKYNDTYGHQAGDKCLRQVANAIANIPNRQGDFTARYGGEEFVVILTNTQLKGAMKIGEDIRKFIEVLEIPHNSSDVCPYVTVSIGVVSVLPFECGNPYDFVNKADLALYSAKRNGRNNVQEYIGNNETVCKCN